MPKLEANQESTAILVDKLVTVAASAILSELRDPKKATAKYLSSLNTNFSWDNVTGEEILTAIGRMSTYYPAKRLLGAATQQLKCFGQIYLASAAAVSQIQINGDLSREIGMITPQRLKESLEMGHIFSLQRIANLVHHYCYEICT